ncbi:Lrp/AsnC family transcriptional regulator [Microbacterium marinilacus]|uniref:Lrp/AsnC family transcriptional regulator n=1 Tax=Microbacterium marinilacus TaxID=415209 RepID=A0ABP7BPC4_9MICO|nr:Lrp/AsnC family transcriptional regulator [Microbacterium marinilacus]MBY0690251.1 Lrp/AsnC family transcriptional regulator [Microbacterium marinilacus]
MILDELDFQLVNALQIAPRAPWATLAPALRTDASTLSRRWARLTEAGIAWTTCYVLPQRMQAYSALGERLRSSYASIEIRCEAGRRAEVIDALARKPEVINIECTSGSRDLSLNVASAAPGEIDDYVDTQIAPLPGVISTNTRFVRIMYREGSEYDLNALRPAQRVGVDEIRRTESSVVESAEPSSLNASVIAALQPDVRRPASEVADIVGISVPLARRAISRLMHSDWVRMRADFAHEVVGWNASVNLWVTVPQDALERLATGLALLPSVRLCASTIGPANLVTSLWLRELEELDEIELHIRRLAPEARVVDRWMVTRVVKRMGTLFDDAGRRRGYVPVPLPSIGTS